MSTRTDKFKNIVFVPVKVSIRPTWFYGFGISITFKDVFKPKTINSDAF